MAEMRTLAQALRDIKGQEADPFRDQAARLCAERSALAHAVAEGVLPGDVEVVAVYAAIPNAPSCGACLQWLTEFQVERIIFMKGGEPRSFLLKELLPEAFAL